MEKDVKEYSDFNSNITKIPEFTEYPVDISIKPVDSHIANHIKNIIDTISKVKDEIHIINRVPSNMQGSTIGKVTNDIATFNIEYKD